MPRKAKPINREPVVVDSMPDINNSKDSDVDMSEVEEFRLPPMPVAIRPYTDKDTRYAGEKDNFRHRISHKLYSLWILWAVMRVSPELKALLDKTCEEETDEYKTKCILVDTMDALGKLLGNTNILEEIVWLSEPDETKFMAELYESRKKAESVKQSPPPPPEETPIATSS